LLPECISDMSKLPPSASQIVMQMGRADYRLAHWMRAILPTIDLGDFTELTGFMPLPGSGDKIKPDGSNAAFDWGTPEHLPEHLEALAAAGFVVDDDDEDDEHVGAAAADSA